MSPAYCRIEIPSPTRCRMIPDICPSSFAHFIKIACKSVTMLNSIGERGCLVEGIFSFETKFLTSSLTFTATLPPIRKDLIQDIHLPKKPFIFKLWNRKGRLTLSYAFSKSILRITPFFSMDLIYRFMKNDNTLKDVSSPHECNLRWANDMFCYPVNSVCSNFSE
jgi:hypothetical protein